ncbi:MAG: hypothetical protein D6B26_07375, partial [Spirochaetaceae bacterium]
PARFTIVPEDLPESWLESARTVNPRLLLSTRYDMRELPRAVLHKADIELDPWEAGYLLWDRR